MLKHVENGITCERNVKGRSLSKKSNLSANLDADGNKRKKSRNRDSMVFKNSFAQHCKNSESLKTGTSYTKKVLSNSAMTADKVTCNSNSSMQVADEIEETPVVVIHEVEA
jgi:hypothetical protein